MVGNDSFPHQRMFGKVSKPLSGEISDILEIRPKFALGSFSHILSISKLSIWQLLLIIIILFIRSRQSVLSVFRPNFWTSLDKNDIRQRRTRQCVVMKCLHGLVRNETFRGGSLFSWIGNFFRLPQSVVDIPGTWHLLRLLK